MTKGGAKGHRVTPEAARAVLRAIVGVAGKAVVDWCKRNPERNLVGREFHTLTIKERMVVQQVYWLLIDNADFSAERVTFVEACDLLQVDPVAIREGLRRKLKPGDLERIGVT